MTTNRAIQPHGSKGYGVSTYTRRFALLAAATGFLAGSSALAADMSNRPAMGIDMSKPMGDQGASSKAFAEANGKMHKGLMLQFSGDTDADFVRWMIPHHQGAIDVAKVELEYGKDPDMLKMAKMILNQENEIEAMNAWLKAHKN